MMQGGHGTSFTLEACKPLGITGCLRMKYLESDVSSKLGVRGAIHLAHPARANCGVDPVMCECTSDQTQPLRVAASGFSRPNRDGHLTLKPDRSNLQREKLQIRMVSDRWKFLKENKFWLHGTDLN